MTAGHHLRHPYDRPLVRVYGDNDAQPGSRADGFQPPLTSTLGAMKRRVATIGGLLVGIPALALASGQELVLYWFTAELVLLVVSVACFFVWRERTSIKLVIFGVVVATAAATNVIPFMPGSLSFMTDVGPTGLLALFTLAPLVVAVLAYGIIRLAFKRAMDTTGTQQSAAADAPKAARR